MEIPETKSFIPKGFELGTTLSYPNWSIEGNFQVQAPRGGGAYIWRGDLTEG